MNDVILKPGRPPTLINPRPIMLNLEAHQLTDLDKRRGSRSRAEFMRQMLEFYRENVDVREDVTRELILTRELVSNQCGEIRNLKTVIDSQTVKIDMQTLKIMELNDSVKGFGKVLPLDSMARLEGLIKEKIEVIHSNKTFMDANNNGNTEAVWVKYNVGWLAMVNKHLTDYGFGKHRLTREELKKRLFD